MRLATPRKTLLLTFFATMLLLSTACIRADMGVSVKDDGTGTITLVEAIDVKAFADAMKQFGGALGGGTTPSNPSDIFNEKDIDKSKLPPGSTAEKYKDGDYEGVKITTPFSKPEDVLPTLNKIADSIQGLSDLGSLGGGTTRPTGGTARPGASPTPQRSSSSGSPSDAFDKFSLAKTSDGWKFEATAKAVGGATSGLGTDATTQALMGAILKDASVTFTLRMPGKVTQTNADSNKNGELKWNLPLTSTQPKTLSATTVGSGTSGGGDDGGGFPIIIVIGVIVAVVVIGGLYYMSRKKQAQPPAPPPPPVPGTSV